MKVAVEIEKKRETRFLQLVKTGKGKGKEERKIPMLSWRRRRRGGVRENPNSPVGFIGSYPTDTVEEG